SPFEIDKPFRRLRILEHHVRQHQLPFVFVNQVGGNDDLVFDGNSLVLDAAGNQILRLQGFESDLRFCDLASLGEPAPPDVSNGARRREADLLEALVLGLRDYMRKSGFTDCVLGLSGGIDSALACYIAATALGPERVHGLAMPSRFSSEH